MLRGLDISHHQGNIYFDKLKSIYNPSFCFIKAAEKLEADPLYAINNHGIKAVGIPRSPYFFFRNNEDSLKQADYFCSVVGSLDDTSLPPILDYEIDSTNGAMPVEQRIPSALIWLQEVKKNLGKTPLFYTSHYFFNPFFGNTDAFKEYGLWVPRYYSESPLQFSDPAPNENPGLLPSSWLTWLFYQYTESGLLPEANNIGGAFDFNLFNGDSNDLAKLQSFITI
jgi:lysozyme